jgi:hypothetical protein
VTDPHLRFWLPFLGSYLPEVERGRGDLLMRRIMTSWSSWRGVAVEPVIREALSRLGDQLPADTRVVGSYWTRTNDPQIDLVGADRSPVASHITFAGSVKWRDSHTFDVRDLATLITHRDRLPGAEDTTPLIAVSRSGVTTDGVLSFGPADLLAAWRA